MGNFCRANEPRNIGWYQGIARGVLLLGCLWLLGMPIPLSAQADQVTLWAVGDIANCEEGQPEATAALLDDQMGEIATLGDTTYPWGTATEFSGCFASTWGRHRARIHPVPGNHEYLTPGAAGYFGYFGAAGTPQEPECVSGCKGYYAFDLGAWRIYALNSEVDMGAGSEQEQWLRAELAAHPASCILAYWHSPRFSSGPHGDSVKSAAVWNVLYAAGADVVLVGHDHHYERFAPQSPEGIADPVQGIREFVVGTGGTPLRTVEHEVVNSEVVRVDTWGILKLTLYPAHYAWEFVPVAGKTFLDTGQGSCIGITPAMTQTLYIPVVTSAIGQKGPE